MILLDLLITLGSSTWTATAPGWKYCEGPLGTHTFVVAPNADTYRVSNGCLPGGGTTTLDSIVITGDRPKCDNVPLAMQTRTATSLTITGPITLPPRSSFVLDVAFGDATTDVFYRHAIVSDHVTYGALQLKIPERHDMAHSTRSQWLGVISNGTAYPAMYSAALGGGPIGGEELVGVIGGRLLLGNRIGNEGGFTGICLMPLTPDAGTIHLRARGHMARHWCDVLDPATGEPVSVGVPMWGEDYAGVCFTSKACTLPGFHEPLAGASDPSKVQPKRWRGVASPHEADLMGARVQVGDWVSWEGGFHTGYDQQHLVRVMASLVAARDLLGDPCAAFDLRVLANDAKLANLTVPTPIPGAGSTFYGTRAAAWGALAMISGGLTTQAGGFSAAAQMGNGCTGNFPYSDYWGFNPSPWLPSGAVPVPLPQTIHACQGMEQEFCEMSKMAGGQGSTRYLDLVYLAGGVGGRYQSPVRRMGYRPKWLGVAEDVAPAGGSDVLSRLHRRVVQFAGNPDYGPWGYLGVGAQWAQQHGKDPEPFYAAMLMIGVDGHAGKAPDHSTLLQWMRTSYQLRSVATVVIPALEMRKL